MIHNPYWCVHLRRDKSGCNGSYTLHGTGMDTIENNGSLLLCSVYKGCFDWVLAMMI